MTFRRFATWLVEKLVELHLAVAMLLIVKLFLPLAPQSFDSVQAFGNGVAETWQSSIDDAAYVTHTFMEGSWPVYIFRTYAASVYVVVVYAYLSSLYVFMSLLACLITHRHYVRYALLAFVASLAVFCWRFIHAWDIDMVRLLVALFVAGLAVVAVSAWFGIWLDGRLGGKRAVVEPKVLKSARMGFDLG